MKFAAGFCLVLGSGALAAGPARAQTTRSDVVVVTATPITGAETDASTIAAPVQTATSTDIEASHTLDLSAFLNRHLGSVYINDIQNSPLQPDVNYRGYAASPLLGTPQGVSLYMDGVRLNQPFGDVVSWDLIPREAISVITLMPGSNPLFGLNTLGGSLSIKTKSGVTDPGSALQLAGGENNRWQAQASTGGADGGFNWYGAANYFSDDGWRDASPSDATQAFGKLGWANDATDIALSASFADTNLTGNGLQEQRFLERNYASIYTKPDVTENRAWLLNLTASHDVSDAIRLSGDVFYRNIRTRTLNGDINDESLTENIYQPNAAERAALTRAGYAGFPTAGETAANTPFPSWRCIANILLNTEPGEKCNGLLNRTRTSQNEGGVTGQIAIDAPLGGHVNAFVAGAAYVQSRAHFRQSSQYGYLTPDRGIATVDGPGAFADGTQDSENTVDARVDVAGKTRTWSLYAADTLDVLPELHLTLSGRYNSTKVENRDALTPSGPGTLTGDHDFSRFNPAMGLTYTPTDAVTLYVGYSEGTRAPSTIELGCADPGNPCRLPNAMAGDPPLEQVVARTTELGARGKLGWASWSAGLFRAENSNDIIFVADDISGFGYFKNFGRTRRQGVELGLGGQLGPVSLSANYTLLDATYRTEETVNGTGNSTNDIAPGFEGAITVQPGDRIPLIPREIFKASAIWDATAAFSLSANVLASRGVYARGNENNAHQPDGVFYIGPGKTSDYAILNLGADYKVGKRLRFFLDVSNVFDKTYSTAAQLGSTGFTASGAFIARPFAGPVIDGERPTLGATFYAPGAPRLFWAGVRYTF